MRLTKKKRKMISVIMPVFNTERYVCAAIESILRQTYANFELIIVNDYSRDLTMNRITRYEDSRVRVIQNSRRLGVAKSLNQGLKLARGQYIARMDADDISHPQRFEKQLNFLEFHTDIGVLGSWVKIIDENGKKRGFIRAPIDDASIKTRLFWSRGFVHSAVMMRKSLLQKLGNYDETLNGAEDYDLWLRLGRFTKFHNLPWYLLDYRKTLSSVSFTNLTFVQRSAVRAGIKALTKYGYSLRYILPIIILLISSAIPIGIKKSVYRRYFQYE